MSLIPGTTPTLTIQLDTSISGCTAAQLCIRCDDAYLVREMDELEISADGTSVSATLTQTETLLFPNDKIAKVQLRVVRNGKVMATEVLTVSTHTLLHREELLW